MVDLIIAGIDTNVGKTVVSAILCSLFKGDYWKPIESGELDADSTVIAKLLPPECNIHPPAYSFKASLSPHHAARLENQRIDPEKIIPPSTSSLLIAEMAGGVLVPLNESLLSIELFKSWKAPFILVSKNYLGSINHTLLTIEALKKEKIPIFGLIFNGEPNPDSEKAILEFSKIPFLARLLPETTINLPIIERYVHLWQQFGTLSLK